MKGLCGGYTRRNLLTGGWTGWPSSPTIQVHTDEFPSADEAFIFKTKMRFKRRQKPSQKTLSNCDIN